MESISGVLGSATTPIASRKSSTARDRIRA
jgi:hypothetical protein